MITIFQQEQQKQTKTKQNKARKWKGRKGKEQKSHCCADALIIYLYNTIKILYTVIYSNIRRKKTSIAYPFHYYSEEYKTRGNALVPSG